MSTFLDDLAKHVIATHGQQVDQLTMVFPNRRAGLFFRKYLAARLSGPVWSPTILSMEEFVDKLSEHTVADRLQQVFELFKVYRKYMPGEDSFDRFYYWGEMLLSDFDEVDKQLVNAKNLFHYLESQKEIDQLFDFLSEEQKRFLKSFWRTFEPSPRGQQHDFLRLWKVLYKIYTDFGKQLRSQQLAYTGQRYRALADACREERLIWEGGPVLFAGFHALSRSEEQLIRHFIQHKGAEVHWDIDAYYMADDPQAQLQEAGHFLREYRQSAVLGPTFPKELPEGIRTPKDIDITAVALEIGQAKRAGEVLQDWMKEQGEAFDPEKTVVILPQEGLLFPVLHALPPDLRSVNVTMGYPLRTTPLYNLLERLVAMQQSLRTRKDGTLLYHHSHVLAILRHPYIYFATAEASQENIREIERENRVYIDITDLPQTHAIYEIIFKQVGEGRALITYLLQVLEMIHARVKPGGEDADPGEEKDNTLISVEREYVYHFYVQLKRLRELLEREAIQLTFQTFLKLFRQVIRNLRLPFTGEPLRGLQVMGMLETRNLDFDNVIILSMNEGSWPPDMSSHSFIPYNLRRAFGMPTVDHQDAIYSYLFYRLLQRAKRVHFFYNTEDTSRLSSEMSRYLQQLIYESGLSIREHILSNEPRVQAPLAISIPKDDSIFASLDRFLHGRPESSRLTPSAINVYLACRLRFYYRYVARLIESDQVTEDIDAPLFGNLLHNSMEILYEAYMEEKGRKEIVKEDIKPLKDRLDGAITLAFKREYGVKPEKRYDFEGRNIIAREIIRQMAARILDYDEAHTPFEIIGLETQGEEGFYMNLPIHTRGQQEQVQLRGIIDRIDRLGDTVRVIDYKTGKDKQAFASIDSLFDRDDAQRNKAAMQTFLYSMLYVHREGTAAPVMPGLFNVKDLFKDNFDIRLEHKEGRGKGEKIEDVRPWLAPFGEKLTALLTEIWDPATPFDQTTDEKQCRNCPYNHLCHRD